MFHPFLIVYENIWSFTSINDLDIISLRTFKLIKIVCIEGSYDIALVGIHVKPTDAVKEIDALIDVYDDVIRIWPTVKVRHLCLL